MSCVGYPYQHPGSYSYDSSQPGVTHQAAAGYNPYYASTYGYPQQTSSTSYNSQPSTNTGSHVNYDNYPGYGGGSRAETAAGTYGQSYPQSYGYGAGGAGQQGMQHG